MSSELAGLKDVPISEAQDEALGLTEYANALVQFSCTCDTPMTIALQGDWGSGKTSLMNLIKAGVEADSAGKIQTIWFNTWQYSQFSMSDTLALSMIGNFIDEVEGAAEKSRAKETLGRLGRVARVGFTYALGRVAGDAGAAKEATSAMLDGETGDPARELKNLKEQLEEMVAARKDVGRFVIFIDDLDRLVPLRAVELLESLKLFLDINKCVFVLACDYQVVVQGLKEKFGVGEAELKGKSFFDKIIQVPFNMPITQYQVRDYFDRLLTRIKVDHDSGDLQDYIGLVNYSVGFNPRSMKRLFNSLLLLHLVAEQKAVLKDVAEQAEQSEVSRILFAILCLQNAYEPVYRYLVRQKEFSDEVFDLLKDDEKLMNDETLDGLRRELGHDGDPIYYQKLGRFMEAFYSSIQLASDETEEGEKADATLSKEEGQTLRRIMSFSSMVSTTAADDEMDYDERYWNRDMAKELAAELNKRYRKELKPFRRDLGKGFTIYQEKSTEQVYVQLYLQSKSKEFNICFNFCPNEMDGWLCASKKRSFPETRAWVEGKVAPAFPEIEPWDDEEWGARLFHEAISGEWEDRAELYKEQVRATLDEIMPLFVERLKDD